MREKSVLITGGAGFLGRAILRKAIREKWGSRFTVVSRDETKQDELMRKYGKDLAVRCYLGDVAQSVDGMARLMAGHDVVIHAAAVKYIPEAEHNRWECERVNVQGSKNVALAAKLAGVPVVVGISTDKAVAPVNFYGMTKAVMEGLFAEADAWTGPTRFVTVRYGNVVGSTGSVIPLFTRQVYEGRITITDNRMTRFWLDANRAVKLVEEAIKDIDNVHGATVIDACPAMSIKDVATSVALVEKGNSLQTPIDVIGMRPGEKLAESLLSPDEAFRACYWPPTGGFILYSPVDDRRLQAAPPALASPTLGYHSADPDSWVNVEEMARWIREAKEI